MKTIPHFDFGKRPKKPKVPRVSKQPSSVSSGVDVRIGDTIVIDCVKGRVRGTVVSLMGTTVLHVSVAGEEIACWRKNLVAVINSLPQGERDEDDG